MRGTFSILLSLIILATASPATLAATEPAPQVQIVAKDGGYLVTTPEYQARVGADGNLHSLIVQGMDLLDDTITQSDGAAFFADHPIALPQMTLSEHTITATDGTYTIGYTFDEGFISLTLKHTHPQGAAYVAICSAQMAFVADLDTHAAAATPADYDWTDVKVMASSGQFLEFHGGSRVWGSGLGRQAWERSALAPHKEYTIRIVPGMGDPRPPELSQLVALSIKMTPESQLVAAGKAADLQVRFTNNSSQAISSELAISVISSLGQPALDERKPFTCDAHRSVTLDWTVAPAAPDFYTVTCVGDLNGTACKALTTFGYNVEAIAPSVSRPADFTAYWDQVVAEAKSIAPQMQIVEAPDRSTSSVKVCRIGIGGDGSTYFGWLAVPKYPGRYPGLLVLQGDRAKNLSPNASLAALGFVVMTVEPTGQAVDGPIQPLISRVFTHLANPATVGLRGVAVRYLRAITALASAPEVDPNRLAVTGVGLGGGMSLLLAGLDERVQAVAADVPSYACIEWGKDAPGWPYKDIVDDIGPAPAERDAAMRTLCYFDVANFADRITCPVLLSAGVNDVYSRPATIYGLNNRLPGPHAINLYIAGHEGGGARHWETKVRWLTQVLGGASPLPAAAPAATPPETSKP